jgi:hypothetical protein
MSKIKFIDIYNLTNKKDYEEAIELIEKIVERYEDLEEYYFKLIFFVERDEIGKNMNWWKDKLEEIKEEYKNYLEEEEKLNESKIL